MSAADTLARSLGILAFFIALLCFYAVFTGTTDPAEAFHGLLNLTKEAAIDYVKALIKALTIGNITKLKP